MEKGWMFLSSWRSKTGVPNEGRSDGYTLWAYFVPKVDTPAIMAELNAEKLREMVLAGVRGWASAIENVVRKADPSTIAPVFLRSTPHLGHWEPNNITLLGDAKHSMTPAAGFGANTALRDAEILTACLVEAANGNTNVAEAIGKYEATMRPYANAAVALSRQLAEGASSKSLGERFMFRMVLWLAQASPFVMRATIGRGAVEV